MYDRKLEKMVGHENSETAYVVTHLVSSSAKGARHHNGTTSKPQQ